MARGTPRHTKRGVRCFASFRRVFRTFDIRDFKSEIIIIQNVNDRRLMHSTRIRISAALLATDVARRASRAPCRGRNQTNQTLVSIALDLLAVQLQERPHHTSTAPTLPAPNLCHVDIDHSFGLIVFAARGMPLCAVSRARLRGSLRRPRGGRGARQRRAPPPQRPGAPARRAAQSGASRSHH